MEYKKKYSLMKKLYIDKKKVNQIGGNNTSSTNSFDKLSTNSFDKLSTTKLTKLSNILNELNSFISENMYNIDNIQNKTIDELVGLVNEVSEKNKLLIETEEKDYTNILNNLINIEKKL